MSSVNLDAKLVAEAMWNQFGDHGCFFCKESGDVSVFTDPEIFDFLKWVPSNNRKGILALRVKPVVGTKTGKLISSKKFRTHVHDPMELIFRPECKMPGEPDNQIAIYRFNDYNVVSDKFAPEIARMLTEEEFNVKYRDTINLLTQN